MFNHYDFLNLSFVEFEEVCHDLLEKEWQMQLQSFAEGADEGIDLRAFTDSERQIIVQCKRYKDYRRLYQAMKLELPKLERHGKFRYILATSVNLTKGQHQKLTSLLYPFLSSPKDIIANKGLN